MDNSKKIIDKIKSENIQPIPRWKFLLKNGAVWTGFSLAVVLGALAFSVVLFSIQESEFDLLTHMSHSKLEFFLGLLPIFWILTLVLFLILAIFSVQYSRKGYKFTVSRLVAISAALSILLGTLFFIAGGGEKLENAFAVNVEVYQSLQEKKVRIWMNTEEGFLSGTIVHTKSGNSLQLKDFEENTWEIQYQDAFVSPRVLLEPGEKIKLVGKLIDKRTFEAEEIRPWGGRENRAQGKKGRQE